MRFVPLLFIATAAYADKGSVKGMVTYEGEAPEPKAIDRKIDPVCKPNKDPSDALIVTKGKIKDVVVRVIGGPKAEAPPEPLILDQKGCTYSPHVSAIVPGQKIRVRNSDGTFHNVHGTVDGRDLWNKPQIAGSPELDLAADVKPGEVIDVVCNVHTWMHAYVAVEDSSAFVVTKDDGTFEIGNLDPGTYTLESWHPVLGKRTQKFEIGKGARGHVNARLIYKASDSPSP